MPTLPPPPGGAAQVDAAQLEAVHHMLAPFCLRRWVPAGGHDGPLTQRVRCGQHSVHARVQVPPPPPDAAPNRLAGC